ncbi:MAG: glycosyltransferase family 2 protein [Paracoccus sp. (in: a-proteobacteria)]|nr:glycosyltransferase family 2 protein [Paracoccus sp. (in: a-proteobacteria)]
MLPAHQEEAHIGRCLDAVRDQKLPDNVAVQLVIVANGCTDRTAEIARSRIAGLQAAGWHVVLLETPQGGKIHALNLGDRNAQGDMRLYLDADIVVGPGMIAGLLGVLSQPGARYAGARLTVPPARSAFSRAYARFWQRLPLVASGVTGAGLFAVNAEGRARWTTFPQVIADDLYVRLLFAPEERHLVDIAYEWPITEGFRRLVRVRRRQDAGTAEVLRLFPELSVNNRGDRPSLRQVLRIGRAEPAGFMAYALVAIAVRMGQKSASLERGR